MAIVELFCLSFLLTLNPVISSNTTKTAEYDIVTDQVKIRGTFDQILKGLFVKVRNTSKLRREKSIQNFLWNLTKLDLENIQEVVKVTRLNDTENVKHDFIDVINEIVNENLNSTENGTFYQEQSLVIIDDFRNELIFLLRHYKEEMENNIQTQLTQLGFEDKEDDDHVYKPGSDETLPGLWSSDDNGRRIFDGQQTVIKNFPFVAAVRVFGQFYCAGSIIAPDLIITAASCLQLAWNNSDLRESPTFISVRVGSSYHGSGGKIFIVKELHFNPEFNISTLKGNLCILRLEEHLDFDDKNIHIKRIKMDKEAKHLAMTVPGVAMIGWGARFPESSSMLPDILFYSVIDVFKFSDCQDIYTKDYVQEENFCAGFTTRGGGACSNDVGDPGLVDGVLTGIVSFGSPTCGAHDAPTVFTKLGYYQSWIEGIMGVQAPTMKSTSKTIEKVHATIKIKENSKTTQSIIKSQGNEDTNKTSAPQITATVEKALRTYFGEDENTYKAFLRSCQDKEIGIFANLLNATNKTKPNDTLNITVTHKVKQDERSILANKHSITETTTDQTKKHIEMKIERKEAAHERTKNEYHKKHKHHHHSHHRHKTSKKIRNIDFSKSLDLTEKQQQKTTQTSPETNDGVLGMAQKFQKNQDKTLESQEIVDQIMQSLRSGVDHTELADIFQMLNIPINVDYSYLKQDQTGPGRTQYIEDLLNALILNDSANKVFQTDSSTPNSVKEEKEGIFARAIKYLIHFII